MELYYKAVTKKGNVLHGRVEAKDKNEAARYLRAHDIYPIKVSEQSEQLFSHFIPFYRRATANDVIFFTRQLSSMLSSGLNLMQSLTVLRNQVTDKYISEVLQGITSDIQDGGSFAKALSKYPQMFSGVYVALIKAGEKAGLLDKVLDRLAMNLEKSKELKDTIRGALIYPIIVIVIMIGVIAIMMLVVVPQLATLYKSLNVQLPLLTKIVIAMSNFFVAGLPFIVASIIGGIYLWRRWYRSAHGRMAFDTFLLKIPLIGKLVREAALAEFSRTFSLLIGTGSLVVDSLQQCSTTVDNVYFRDSIQEVAKRVEKGITIGDALAANPIFPSILVEMTRIGEQTGKLDESLLRVSQYFQREVEQLVKALTTAIEPIILVVLGASVGVLIVAIITPIYNLIAAIH